MTRDDAIRKAAITEAVAPWKSAAIEQLIIAHIRARGQK